METEEEKERREKLEATKGVDALVEKDMDGVFDDEVSSSSRSSDVSDHSNESDSSSSSSSSSSTTVKDMLASPVVKTFISPQEITRTLGKGGVKSTSKKYQNVSHRDAFSTKDKKFTSQLELIYTLNDEFEEFTKDQSEKNRRAMRDLLAFGVWVPHGDPISAGTIVGEGKIDKISSYHLSLCTMDPYKNGLLDLSKRHTGKVKMDWVFVAESTLPDAGWGLFSARTFANEEVISVYIGHVYKKSSGNSNSHYRLFHDSKIIDPVLKKKPGKVPLHLGAHLANDITWHKTDISGEEKRRHNNAEFQGLLLVATAEIRPRQEFFVHYNLVEMPK